MDEANNVVAVLFSLVLVTIRDILLFEKAEETGENQTVVYNFHIVIGIVF